ncbi:hypothetical protein CARUB_v10010713mg [Capsella rubella]|uniref:Uncharacterized protein n=1 Tax=Capsella rubella TaxID=81985 RepID=R0I1K2_9BRAS|nr:uncharacterized protein LOC17900417 [Capsella rubella]EOA36089.1 hypothetical protein CARUB_v10010713mg [Capsella rubella]
MDVLVLLLGFIVGAIFLLIWGIIRCFRAKTLRPASSERPEHGGFSSWNGDGSSYGISSFDDEKEECAAPRRRGPRRGSRNKIYTGIEFILGPDKDGDSDSDSDS